MLSRCHTSNKFLSSWPHTLPHQLSEWQIQTATSRPRSSQHICCCLNSSKLRICSFLIGATKLLYPTQKFAETPRLHDTLAKQFLNSLSRHFYKTQDYWQCENHCKGSFIYTSNKFLSPWPHTSPHQLSEWQIQTATSMPRGSQHMCCCQNSSKLRIRSFLIGAAKLLYPTQRFAGTSSLHDTLAKQFLNSLSRHFYKTQDYWQRDNHCKRSFIYYVGKIFRKDDISYTLIRTLTNFLNVL